MRRLLVCLLLATASIARAQDTGYVGLSYGSLDYEEDFVDNILGEPVSDTIDHYKLFGGFEILQHLAVEVNYSKAGDVEESVNTNIPPYGDVSYVLDMDLTITSVKAMGILPYDWGALFAGLGMYSSELDFRDYLSVENLGSGADYGTVNDDGMNAVIGVEWRFGRFGARYGFRLEYEWWDMDGASASAIGLGGFYGF